MPVWTRREQVAWIYGDEVKPRIGGTRQYWNGASFPLQLQGKASNEIKANEVVSPKSLSMSRMNMGDEDKRIPTLGSKACAAETLVGSCSDSYYIPRNMRRFRWGNMVLGQFDGQGLVVCIGLLVCLLQCPYFDSQIPNPPIICFFFFGTPLRAGCGMWATLQSTGLKRFWRLPGITCHGTSSIIPAGCLRVEIGVPDD